MRKLLIGVAAIALSGCSWFGGKSHHDSNYNSNTGYYSGHQIKDDCCVGGKTLSRWNLEGGIGPEFVIGGDALTGSEINPRDGVVATNLSMKDAYDPGFRYEIGGSYALNPNRKVTVMGSYAEADGETVTLGTANGNVIGGDLTDYQRYGVEVGLRQYFMPQKAPLVNSIRPYVEGRIGAAHVDDIGLTNLTSNGQAINGNIGLYESGWVPTGAGLVGVETPLFDRTTIGLETGVRYTGILKSDTNSLPAGNPFAGANNGSSSWTVPVMLRGRYRF